MKPFLARALRRGAAVWYFALLAAAAGPVAAGPLAAQEPPRPPELVGKHELDDSEISRRGDLVTVTGEGQRNTAELLFTMAMAPPADDSGQWFVSVFGRGDAASTGLVKAFETDPHLAPFIASPREGVPAWAHFNFYRLDDPTQQWRLKEFGIDPAAALPIVIVQPPRDGSFGGIVKTKDARGQEVTRMVVIDRIDGVNIQAAGAAEALRRRLTASVKLWNETLAKNNFVPPAKVVRRFTEDADRLAKSDSHGQGELQRDEHGQQPAFPWGPQTPPPATPVHPVFPPGGPAADPMPAPSGALLRLVLAYFPSVPTLLLFLTAASNVWMLYREFARTAGIQLLIDEATYQKLRELLAKLGPSPPQPAPPSGPAS